MRDPTASLQSALSVETATASAECVVAVVATPAAVVQIGDYWPSVVAFAVALRTFDSDGQDLE